MNVDDLIVYHKGDFRRYADSRIGLLTHALNYGTGCFEGIRAFWNPRTEQLSVFEPTAHFRRLDASANLLLMALPFSPQRFSEIAAELCRRNGFRSDAYLRPVVYKSEETFGVRLDDLEHDVFIVGFENARYLESNEGVNACVSTWRRVDDNAAPARAKITGTYVNAALAKSEARLNGFDEAILLTEDGQVSEASAANLFIVRDGIVATPLATANNLEGITRKIVGKIIARETGLQVVERVVDRTELYSAAEIILCGTGVGVAWLRSIDHRKVGSGVVGPVASVAMKVYDDVVRGRNDDYDVERFDVYERPLRAVAS